MVHALDEIRRVLAAQSALVDLRPLMDRWPIEIAWRGGQQEAARATDLNESLEADADANAAMAALAASGGMRLEQQETFPLHYYWDTPNEMKQHIDDEWSDVITIDDTDW